MSTCALALCSDRPAAPAGARSVVAEQDRGGGAVTPADSAWTSAHDWHAGSCARRTLAVSRAPRGRRGGDQVGTELLRISAVGPRSGET